MANKYLASIYNNLFDQRFDCNRFEHRLELQKGIYLLQDLGVPVSEYGFSWYKHGPYSQTLLDDMYRMNDASISTEDLSDYSQEQFLKLREAFTYSPLNEEEYNLQNWVECVASIHFLKENVLPRAASEELILDELTRRKPHLSNFNLNQKAFKVVNSLFS
ncbi:MAG: hypothetical protein PHW03_05980 [Eubacteriales bacterium]|nr:hypothetical protein [Eubacteriales bacterium]